MEKDFLLGLLTGASIILTIVKIEGSLVQRQENKLLKIENANLRAEREERKAKIDQNGGDIRLLKDRQKELEDLCLTCLNLISSVTSIKNQIDLNTTIIATERYRKIYGLMDDKTINSSKTYISDD